MLSPKTIAAVFTAALFARSTIAAQCARKYTVKEGDICDSISANQHVSTYQLAVVNHGHVDAACGNLTPGDELCLGWAGEDCSSTYVVKDNDTCEAINQAHGLNSTILYLNNPQINQDCTNIYIGEVLCVSQTVQVPAAPAGQLPATTIPATATPAPPNTPKTAVSTPAHTLAQVPTPAPSPSAPAEPAPQHEDEDCDDDDNDDEDKDDDDDDEDDDDKDDEDDDDKDDDDKEDDKDIDDDDLPFCDEL